jgi:hypothetical protein
MNDVNVFAPVIWPLGASSHSFNLRFSRRIALLSHRAVHRLCERPLCARAVLMSCLQCDRGCRRRYRSRGDHASEKAGHHRTSVGALTSWVRNRGRPRPSPAQRRQSSEGARTRRHGRRRRAATRACRRTCARAPTLRWPRAGRLAGAGTSRPGVAHGCAATVTVVATS